LLVPLLRVLGSSAGGALGVRPALGLGGGERLVRLIRRRLLFGRHSTCR
jgi:hypothetical protein